MLVNWLQVERVNCGEIADRGDLDLAGSFRQFLYRVVAVEIGVATPVEFRKNDADVGKG